MEGTLDLPSLLKQETSYGLQSEFRQALVDLDRVGMAVIGPEVVSSEIDVGTIRDGLLATARDRSGVVPDLETGGSHQKFPYSLQAIDRLLIDCPAIEQLLFSKLVDDFARALLGPDYRLSAAVGMVKGPGIHNVPGLHCDAKILGDHLPERSPVCNVTLTLSDYNEPNGGLIFWPASHHLCRNPSSNEQRDWQSMASVCTPAGSVIAWAGNTWHGAVARRRPGLRLNIALYFRKPDVAAQEDYSGALTIRRLEANRARLRTLLGVS